MKGILLEDVIWSINDNEYHKNQEVVVFEVKGVPRSYAVYVEDTLDWIPKHLIKIL